MADIIRKVAYFAMDVPNKPRGHGVIHGVRGQVMGSGLPIDIWSSL